MYFSNASSILHFIVGLRISILQFITANDLLQIQFAVIQIMFSELVDDRVSNLCHRQLDL